MPNIVPTNYINIENELTNLELYKYHPNGILNVSLNRLSDMLDGKIDIVDPSNPFLYLLETSCLNTAFAIQEHTLLTRKLYPKLANNENDLYLHMSDYDYLGIYSEPAYGYINFNILLNDIRTKSVKDINTGDYLFKIPRHFKVSIGNYVFTLPSAIIIRLANTNSTSIIDDIRNYVIDIKYENQTFNNIFPIETNSIEYNILGVWNQELSTQETYIHFKIKMPEVDIESTEIPLEKSKLFKGSLSYNPKRKFYYFRAFYLDQVNTGTNTEIWKELSIIHNNEVYDINTPTCCISVDQSNSSVNYYIPSLYINNNIIKNKVKFLIYTTNGYIDVNFADYKISDFITEYNSVFPNEELDDKVKSLHLITKYIYIDTKINGGKNNISFNDIKNNVINNSLNKRQLPITNKQAEYYISQYGFKLIKDVDIVTNKIFLLEVNIPKANTRYPITSINTDMIEYKTTISNLKVNSSCVDIDQNVTIIPENSVFKIDGNSLVLLDKVSVNNLNILPEYEYLSELNKNKYLFNPYTYILDTSNNEISLRTYLLSNPKVNTINFKETNPSTNISINTSGYTIVKRNDRYELFLTVNFKKYIDSLDITNITPYLIYTDHTGYRFYLKGRLNTSVNNVYVYKFDLITNFYINKENKIQFINTTDANNNRYGFVNSDNLDSIIFLDKIASLDLVYVTNQPIQPGSDTHLDINILSSFISNSNNHVVTLETITIKFFDELNYLYSRVHNSIGDQQYQKYTAVEYLTYDKDVYTLNTTTNTYTLTHSKNDFVLDNNGNKIIKHNIGDIVLDTNGNPIPIGTLDINRYLNLLLIDYKAKVSTDTNISNYLKYVLDYITNKVTIDAVSIQNDLLELTEGYVTVPKNISKINVKIGDSIRTIDAAQSFSVRVYLLPSVYKDKNIRDTISYIIISEIDNYLYDRYVISKSELLSTLYTKLKDYIENITIVKFTELNEEYIQIIDTSARISLNKIISRENNYITLLEDVSIDFISV